MLMLPLFMLTVSSGCDNEKDPLILPIEGFQLKVPANGAEEVNPRTTFEWETANNAEGYHLIVSKAQDFSDPFVDEAGIEDNSFTLSQPLDDGTLYYWKVIAVSKSGNLEASNSGYVFRTVTKPPAPSPGITRYYVSPNGEDNPDRGTSGKPFSTLAYAATRVPANEGDTIFLLPGNYVETRPARIPTGVSIVGSGEEQTVISSEGVSVSPGIDINSPSFKLWYDGSLIQLVSPHRKVFRNNGSQAIAPANGNQTISGFTINGGNKKLKAGVWVENRNNVNMHHITFKNLAQRGAVFAPGDKDFYLYPEFYMTGISIHDCKFINSGRDLPDETLGNLCIAQLDGAEIFNISISDIEGYGIKFIYDGYFKNTSIHDCNITVNEVDANWQEDIAIELWNVGPGNKIQNIVCNTWLSIVNHPDKFADGSAWNAQIRSVRMIDRNGVSNKEAIEIAAPNVELSNSYFENKGFGVAVWDMGRSNIVIRNNVFRNMVYMTNWTSGAGVYIDNSWDWDYDNIKIYNNVFDKFNTPVHIKGNRIKRVEVVNNAFIDTGIADLKATGDAIIFQNNLKNAGAWETTGATTESFNLIAVPEIVATGNRWDTWYKPSGPNSNLIDKGRDVGIPFSGNAPDIGAYEL